MTEINAATAAMMENEPAENMTDDDIAINLSD